MENIFLRLLNMSLTAGILVVAVLLLRVVLHKAPRWIHVLLWALVAVRLLCPFTIESNLSLMPDTPAVSVPASAPAPDTPPVENAVPDTPVMDSPTVIPPVTEDPSVMPPVVDTPPMTVIPPATDTPVVTPTPESSVVTATPETVVTPWQMVLTVATYVWLAGVALLAAYAVFTTLRLRRQVGEAAHIADNLWQCDHLRSPFILGVFRPRIYLPSDLSAAARDSVVAHEQAHLRRRDHWWKPLGFVLLMVYWFNPLMWVAYVFLCRDIEAACDESVVRNMNAADRRAYSEALLSCSAPRRLVSACPLAFGETAVKSRIKSVLSYKKPTIWIIVAALLVSTVAGVCLLTNRPADKPDTDKPAVSDKDDDPDEEGDEPPAATAPVGLTYADRSDIGSGEEAEEIFGSSRVKRFDSRAEFETFLTTYQKTERNHNRWEISDFDQFDETFFTENVLLMTRYTLGSGSITPYVAEYTYSEDRTILSVGVDELHPSFGTDDMAFWLLFSGIKKVDLQGVTELESYLRKEIPTDSYMAAFTEPTKYPDKATEKWREFYGYWDEVYLRAMITRLNDGAWVENSSAINRALNFVGCVHINGNLYYVTDQFDGIMSTDGKVGWLTTEESVRVSWLFDEKEHPAYTFIGKVKKVDGNNVLMECLESEWLTGDVWVDFSRFVKSRVGETLKITYDYMELTDPPRVTPIEVAYVSVNPTTGTTTTPTTGSTTGITGTKPTTPTTKPTTTPTTPSQPETAPVGLTYIIRAGTSSNEEYEALYGTPIRRFDTRAELESFLIEFQTMGRGWKRWEISDFNQFDNAFFAQNSLLVTGWLTSSGMHTPQVAVYTYSEGGTVLSVGVDELHPSFVTDDVGEWLLFSGIKKVDLQGVTELESYLRNEIPTDSYMALLSKRTSNPQTVSEKWRKRIPGDEEWALSYIFAEIEKSDRWRTSSGNGSLFEIALNINGKTYYADRGFYELYSEDGSRRIALTADEYGLLQWVFAYLSEDSDNIWVARFSHPVQDFEYNYTSLQIINASAMRAILERESWIKNSNYSRSYDAFITWRGVYYYVDWANRQIVSNGKVITLTEAEQKYLTPIICDTYWGTKAYVTGYVYESGDGYFVLKVDTQYVKALGNKVKVSLLRWTDAVPAVGSRVGISYDGYTYSYIYPCAIGEYLPEPAHDLEFWIGEFVGDVDFSNYQEKYGLFGGTEYYGTGYAPANNDPAMQVDPEHCVTYIVSSYPDEIDYGAHITSIRITDPNVKVYGISLKSSFDEFERALTQQGFAVEKQGSVARKATKGRFTITFTAEYIYISVATTNRYGIVY